MNESNYENSAARQIVLARASAHPTLQAKLDSQKKSGKTSLDGTPIVSDTINNLRHMLKREPVHGRDYVHPPTHPNFDRYNEVFKGASMNEGVSLVGIMRHKDTGTKKYIWSKGGEGGYVYEVEAAGDNKRKTYHLPLDKVVHHLKATGHVQLNMAEEIELDEGWKSRAAALAGGMALGTAGCSTDHQNSQQSTVCQKIDNKSKVSVAMNKTLRNIKAGCAVKKHVTSTNEELSIDETWTKDGLHLDLKNVKVDDDYMRPEYEQYLKNHGATRTIIKMKMDGMGNKIPQRVHDLAKTEKSGKVSEETELNEGEGFDGNPGPYVVADDGEVIRRAVKKDSTTKGVRMHHLDQYGNVTHVWDHGKQEWKKHHPKSNFYESAEELDKSSMVDFIKNLIEGKLAK